MFEIIDRVKLKQDAKLLLLGARVRPKAIAALYLLLVGVLNGVGELILGRLGGTSSPILSLMMLFISTLTVFLVALLGVGFILYCMDVRSGLQAGYSTLFDGFSFAGKVIGLSLLKALFIFLWSCLFIVPGIIAAYRYRFAMYNLCANPNLTCSEALEMSVQQTRGYKGQLFELDLSYLGWTLFACLPTIALTLFVYVYALALIFLEIDIPLPPEELSLIPVLQLLCSLWAIVAQIFYVPVRQCVELSYFETAIRTSGVSPLPPALSQGERGESGSAPLS